MKTIDKKIKIILTGGGTMGSVSPLLAIAETCQRVDWPVDFLWLGTADGPEHQAVDKANISFKAISAGKWRRYWSWRNLTDLWRFKKGFWQALWLFLRWRPQLIITAGSFVSVPVVLAGWLLRVPIIVHQLDYQPGLANKIMAKLATVVTTTLVKSVKDYGDKAIWVGSLLRQSVLRPLDKETAEQFFGLSADLPTITVLGGGTGSININQLIRDGLEDLIKFCQIIHITGQDKSMELTEVPGYQQYNWLNDDDLALAFMSADLVICRAGMGTTLELSYLAKPTILIPLPNSHQELNAKALQSRQAAIVLAENKLTASDLALIIQEVLYNSRLLQQMSRNISQAFKPDGNQAMLDIMAKILKPATAVGGVPPTLLNKIKRRENL